MQECDFIIGAGGRLQHCGQGNSSYLAFIPHPLPPEVQWSDGLVHLLSKADLALGQLAGLGRTLPNPHLLIRSFIRREAVLSSRIEGTQASLDDLLLFEISPKASGLASDVNEVWNYVRALDYGLEQLAELPLSLRLIRQMHEKLMEGVRGQHRAPGEFRATQNWIGPSGSTLASATYVPPPPHEMMKALDAFERFLHAPSVSPPLIRLAMIHYQFEAIHPFLDGNGRIGRLLIAMILCSENLLPSPLLYLSAYIESHREQYYQCLLGVSTRGDWAAWFEYFLRAVSDSALDAIERAGHLVALWQAYRKRLQSCRSAGMLLQLVDELFITPAFTAAHVMKTLEISKSAAGRYIEKLLAEGILTEVSGQKRNRIYVAREIASLTGAESNGDKTNVET